MAIDGKWKVSWTTPRGQQEVTLDLAVAGGVLTGTFTGAQGNSQNIDGGSLDGDQASWKVNRQGPQGPITLTFAGKVDGDKIAGTVTTPFGTNPFSGARA
jgi:hypothetical protein